MSSEDLALFKACAVEGHDASARVEVSTHGARLASTRQALTTAFGGSKAPMVHLCPQAASACSGPVDGRDAVHVPRWRTRPVPGIKEQGYEVDAADLTGTPEEVKAMGLTALRERLLALKGRLGAEARSAPVPGAAKAGQALSAGMGPAGGGKPAGSHTPRGRRDAAEAPAISEVLSERGKRFAEGGRGCIGAKPRSPERERKKRRRGTRSSDSSSPESEGRKNKRLFRGARTVSERHAHRMTERPGDLMATALDEMKRYLITGQGATSSQEELTPIVRAYLTSVFLPSVGSAISQRNSEELRTLAEATDKILQGDFAGAGDLLLLRFQAIEMAHADGHWRVARHLMPLSDPRPSASTRALRAAAAQDEARATRLGALATQASRGNSPRPPRDGRVG